MWKAMVFKELRETYWIPALVLVAYVYVVAGLTGLEILPWQVTAFLPRVFGDGIPFATDEFVWGFGLIAVGLTIALGIRQTVGESVRGTWLVLLHRPAGRSGLVGMKLVVGAALYLATGAAMILLYAWWASTPGTHASPFFWSMTIVSWRLLVSLMAMYPAAFLAGLLPGRWLGSRALPIAAVGLLLVLIQWIPWWWALGLAVTGIVDAWLVVSILYVVRTRDFS